MTWPFSGSRVRFSEIQLNGLAVPPQTFEIVVRAGAFRKDMDDDVTVIHEDPLGCLIAFDAYRELAYFL